MSTKQAEVVREANELLEGTAPVSFYDAVMLVRRARRAGEIAEGVLASMLRLYDCDHVTDGGRAVMADFLRGVAQRYAQERALASRILRPKDSGKVARAKAGTVILLALSDIGPGQATDWRLVDLSGPARFDTLSPAQASAHNAAVELHLLAPGTVRLELAPQMSAGANVRSSSSSSASLSDRPRAFALRVVVEV